MAILLGLWRAYPIGVHGDPRLWTIWYGWSHWALTYSDIGALYGGRHWALHPGFYWQQPLEYPPVLGALIWASTWAPGFFGYMVANAVGVGGAAAVALGCLARVRGRSAALWAVCPLLVVFSVYNWDLYGIAAFGLAVLAARRERFGWAGVWIGVGAAAKLFPVVLLPFLLADRWRAGDRRGGVAVLGTGLGAWTVLNAPVALTAWHGWMWFWVFNATRGPTGGVYQWLNLPVGAVNGISLGLVLLWGLILLRACGRGRLDWVTAAALGLCGWICLNKVTSPQYLLWAVYALLLAGAGWRTLAALTVAGLATMQADLWGGVVAYTHPSWGWWYTITLAPLATVLRYLVLALVMMARGRSAWRTPASLVPP